MERVVGGDFDVLGAREGSGFGGRGDRANAAGLGRVVSVNSATRSVLLSTVGTKENLRRKTNQKPKFTHPSQTKAIGDFRVIPAVASCGISKVVAGDGCALVRSIWERGLR